MKHNLKTTALVLFGSCCFFLSCKKEQTKSTPVTPAAEDNIQFSNLQNWEAAANPANPYDDEGLNHNLALQFILDSLASDSLTPQPIYNVATAYAYSLGTPAGDAFTTDVPYIWLNNLYLDHFSGIGNLADLAGVIDGMSFAAGISNALKDLYHFADTTTQDYDSVKRKIVLWENTVLISTQFTTAEKETLLRHASIMRYSLYGWLNATYPGAGSGHILYKTTSWRTFWNCVKVVAVDALAGTATGLVTAGTGAVVGAAAASGMAAHLIQNP